MTDKSKIWPILVEELADGIDETTLRPRLEDFDWESDGERLLSLALADLSVKVGELMAATRPRSYNAEGDGFLNETGLDELFERIQALELEVKGQDSLKMQVGDAQRISKLAVDMIQDVEVSVANLHRILGAQQGGSICCHCHDCDISWLSTRMILEEATEGPECPGCGSLSVFVPWSEVKGG